MLTELKNLKYQTLKSSFLNQGKTFAQAFDARLTQMKQFAMPSTRMPTRHLPGRMFQTNDEQPLSWELYNFDQLNRHATTLAKNHKLRDKRKRDHLLARLNSNERALLHAYAELGEAVKAKRRVSPAGEWILDNFHFIEEQIRLAKRHLPQGYSARLPQLAGGNADGHPRVYEIALEIIAHVDGRIDENNITSFVSTYQQTAPLTLGELWAIPIMLRLALIENLRRVAVRVMIGIQDRTFAAHWATTILDAVANDPKNLILVVADMARTNPPLSNAFVAEFTQRLQEYGGLVDIPLAWLDHQFLESGSSIQDKVQGEVQQQAANQVSVSCSIGSLRFLSAIDWREFVQDMSVVENELKCDPAGVYARMDFFTRDRYRHVIEDLARKLQLSELSVTKTANQLARRIPANDPLTARKAHVGYYLIDEGFSELQHTLKVKEPRTINPVNKWMVFYFTSIIVITAFLAGSMIPALTEIPLSLKLIAIVAIIISTSQVGVTIANWLSTLVKAPKCLPRLDFAKEIPTDCKAIVVVPTLLFDVKNVEKLLEGLEMRYFGNRSPNIYFALLTDFADAATEKKPNDEMLLRVAREGIDALNAKHRLAEAPETEDRFFLLHRPREWNPNENVWMSYERKRGKLEALNRLLRGRPCREGSTTPSFSVTAGNLQSLMGIKYVITLDTDTQLPRDSAHKMIGTMAHPLNVALFDATKQRVIAGYGILQPRAAIGLASTNKSWFVRLYGGDGGTDPYTLAISDVYQDLFGEGSFVGKGIYDIDAFTQALAPALPSNLILSHDLIEGAYARSGLLSDVVLYEEHPSHYIEDVKRRRRWIRGDWQILFWLFPKVPKSNGAWAKNPLPFLSRWKIFDNLRRSVVPLATLTVLFIAWTKLPNPHYLTRMVIAVYFLSAFFSSSFGFLNKPSHSRLTSHLSSETRAALHHFIQALLTLMFVPNDAVMSLNSISRSLYRMFISRKKLLEWRSANDPGNSEGWSVFHFYKSMPAGPVAAMVGVVIAILHPTESPWQAVPLLGLWFAAPLVARYLSKTLPQTDGELRPAQMAYLRRLSRRTWRFFEEFVNAEGNWLPPDNFQEYPQPVTAFRTSPTNIGLALLANLTAYDFGYLSLRNLRKRTENTFSTLDKMDRFRGHFYNWYDTLTLKPLLPMYISTVDSGNFIAHIIILETGIRALSDAKVIPQQAWRGLQDTVDLLEYAVRETQSLAQTKYGETTLADHISDIRRRLWGAPTQLNEMPSYIAMLICDFNELRQFIPKECFSVHEWLTAIQAHCEENLLEPLDKYVSWARTLELLLKERPQLASEFTELNTVPTLREASRLYQRNKLHLQKLMQAHPDLTKHFQTIVGNLEDAERSAHVDLAKLSELADRCIDFSKFEYNFLYDPNRNLLSIGYNVVDHRRDAGFYDLLASEARLVSFVGIAQGELPQDHWFTLGRLLTSWHGESMLLSWSGSMFEYLMPLLVMPTYKGTLLDQTYRAVVQRQIEYGEQTGLPWGVSESGYNVTDTQLNYQYRAFGVPGLGFKRGLADDLVIAPYAAMMSLMVNPKAACANLERMTKLGFEGEYGFYEAIDYTPTRLVGDQTCAVIRSFMAHHQGMGFLSLAYLLLDQPMQKRFKATSILQAAELLLHERVPKIAAFYPHAREVSEGPQLERDREASMRIVTTPFTPRPEVHLLSNGRYTVMMTNSGGGYSRWQNVALTRWREDPTLDNWGTFCYVRDVDNEDGDFWSATYQPTLKEADNYEAIFPPSRAEFRCRRDELELHTEIAVSPEDDIELRRFTITNLSNRRRVIELTSYAEVILAPQAADEAHPAFSNLFVQTEILPTKHAILCSRRARSDYDDHPLMLHLMTVYGHIVGDVSYETDRRQFVGRTQSIATPIAMSRKDGVPSRNHNLNGSAGSVLDPIVAIRCRVEIGPEETIVAHMVTGVGKTKDAAIGLIDKYYDRHIGDRVFELAWTHRQVVLRQLDINEGDAQIYGKLANAVLYAGSSLRASSAILLKNRRGQSSLWGYGISGDLPIILVCIETVDQIDVVKEVVRAHGYWRMMGLVVDIVILNEDPSGYRQDLQDQILAVIATTNASAFLDVQGGIFIRRLDQMAEDDRGLLQTIARGIIVGGKGSLREQMERQARPQQVLPPLLILEEDPEDTAALAAFTAEQGPSKQTSLQFANGFGGFSKDGREYIIETSGSHVTPAPWVNVLANPHFGTIVSESGSSYTWCENAHEFRLSPWYNDGLMDSSGEAFYIRDEASGEFWSPTPLPAKASTPYTSIHGFGYSKFRNTNRGIETELTMFVAMDAPVKMTVIKLKNLSNRSRKFSLTGYCEWVLGELRQKSLLHVTTEIDPTNGAILARNPYHPEFSSRIGFLDVSERNRSFTGDRSEFLGRNGSLLSPAAMKRERLSGRIGAKLDPCAALQTVFELAEGEEREITFTFGVGRDVEDVRTLIRRFGRTEAALGAFDEVNEHWKLILGNIQVKTPDPRVDVLVNGWLPYQVISCRLWARSGYYQSGGAFGFRDQLQDAMSLVAIQPRLLREQIVRCSGRQFREGDVQHWWHPPSGRGVRTHFSDDYLWLPLATSRYVLGTKDTGVLDVRTNFLEGRQVKPDEEAYMDLPQLSVETATVYEHCVRAIQYGMKYGRHGLPLIGCGDWNDGMNLVGEHGQGESVWLAFFFYDVLTKFSAVASGYGDKPFAERCLKEAAMLKEQIEKEAWDGEWYRRAYFDSGEPLGSHNNAECQIDSLPQSWSVLTGVGSPERQRQAMAAVDKRLVDRENDIVKLFDPPFDRSHPNPGYIKGYVPGVRENGGQYTHAAIWTAMAFAALGDAEKAWELTRMISPLGHTASMDAAKKYRVEPYVVAADVYAVSPHTGLGGWTWYTGSAAWMYRLIVESLLGFSLHDNAISFTPNLPEDWHEFQFRYCYRNTFYQIRVVRNPTAPAGSKTIEIQLDGRLVKGERLVLQDDLKEHQVEVMFS